MEFAMIRRLALFLVGFFIAHSAAGQTFTKITSGPLVTDGKDGLAGTWVDYDNDDDPDVFVSNGASQTEDLYRNNGDGSFTRITGIPLTTLATNAGGNQWGDYNNDGNSDIMLRHQGTGQVYQWQMNAGAIVEAVSVKVVDGLGWTIAKPN